MTTVYLIFIWIIGYLITGTMFEIWYEKFSNILIFFLIWPLFFITYIIIVTIMIICKKLLK
jgi:hypothetical protein